MSESHGFKPLSKSSQIREKNAQAFLYSSDLSNDLEVQQLRISVQNHSLAPGSECLVFPSCINLLASKNRWLIVLQCVFVLLGFLDFYSAYYTVLCKSI